MKNKKEMQAMVATVGASNEARKELTNEIVRKYICNNATEAEIYNFIRICEKKQLDPFLREIYLVKHSPSSPASTIVSIETFIKNASKNPKYLGNKTYCEGSIEEGNLVGICEAYIEGYMFPIRVEVDYAEYCGRTKEGQITKMWREKPKTMIKKVAKAQALREACPVENGGLYTSDEINTINENDLKGEIIDVDYEETKKPIKPAVQKQPIKQSAPKKEIEKPVQKIDDNEEEKNDFLDSVRRCTRMDELKTTYELAKAYGKSIDDKEFIIELAKVKDYVKGCIESVESDLNEAEGDLKNAH